MYGRTSQTQITQRWSTLLFTGTTTRFRGNNNTVTCGEYFVETDPTFVFTSQSYHLSPVVAVTEAVHICCCCTRFFVIYTKGQHGAKHTTTQLCNLTAKKGSMADEIAVHGGVILNQPIDLLRSSILCKLRGKHCLDIQGCSIAMWS